MKIAPEVDHPRHMLCLAGQLLCVVIVAVFCAATYAGVFGHGVGALAAVAVGLLSVAVVTHHDRALNAKRAVAACRKVAT